VVFKQKVEEVFPKLSDCGGCELLRSGITSWTKVNPISKTTWRLFHREPLFKNNSLLRQALCFIRSIQRDLCLFETTPGAVFTNNLRFILKLEMYLNFFPHMRYFSSSNLSGILEKSQVILEISQQMRFFKSKLRHIKEGASGATPVFINIKKIQ